MFTWDIFGCHSLDRRYLTESVHGISQKTYDSKLDIYNRITVCQLPLYDTSELRNVVTLISHCRHFLHNFARDW